MGRLAELLDLTKYENSTSIPKKGEIYMKWINHKTTTFIIVYLSSHSLLNSIIASLGSLLPDILRYFQRRYSQQIWLFSRFPNFHHYLIFWVTLFSPIIYLFMAYIYNITTYLLELKFLPNPITLLLLIYIGIGLHLLFDSFSESGIHLSSKRKIALEWYQDSTFKEDFFVLSALLYFYLIFYLGRPLVRRLLS